MCHLGLDRMVVIITTTYAINTYHHNVVNSNSAHGEVYSIQQYVIMLVSDLRQVGWFSLGTPVSFTTVNLSIDYIHKGNK